MQPLIKAFLLAAFAAAASSSVHADDPTPPKQILAQQVCPRGEMCRADCHPFGNGQQECSQYCTVTRVKVGTPCLVGTNCPGPCPWAKKPPPEKTSP